MRSISMLRGTLVLVALLCIALICRAPAPAAAQVGAGGDRYTGSGGLILPGSADSGVRRESAGCPDCRWRLSDPCSESGGPCLAVTRGCAQMSYLLRLRLSVDGGSTWSDRGLVCIPPMGPVTVAQVADSLQREFERLVPPLAPSEQPSQGIVTQIPVNFLSGHPAGLSPSSHDLLGHSVLLHPSVRWSWEFGDGSRLDTAVPGSAYPSGTIRHAYRTAGTRQARVEAVWGGSFEVDGLGPFPVAGVIRQLATVEVSVGEGRAVLVP